MAPLCAVQVEGMEFMVDAFNGGELTALQDAEEVLGRLIGHQVNIRAAPRGQCRSSTQLQQSHSTATMYSGSCSGVHRELDSTVVGSTVAWSSILCICS